MIYLGIRSRASVAKTSARNVLWFLLLAIGTAEITVSFVRNMAERLQRSPQKSSSQQSAQVPRKTAHCKLLERNLKDLSHEELIAVADRIRTPVITSLRLFVTAHDSPDVNNRFSLLDRKTTQTCLQLSRALAQAVAGWLQQLELGLRLWNRELKLLADALCSTKTLRRLSFANSGLGDTRFQILARSLRECIPLHTLNLSGCGLTDLSVPYVVNIVKGSPNGGRAKPEEEHNPGQLSPEQALVCQQKLQRAQKTSQEWSSKQFPLQGKWAPPTPVENSVSNQKHSDWQTSLRQSGMCHSTCVPSKEIVDGALGLRSLDLSNNQFTDDLADELCPILYGEAPLSALHLQCNQLTREGAKTFGAVMKDRRVLQLVDLRDNKQGVSTITHSADDFSAAAKSIPCLISPKEASGTSSQIIHPNFRGSTIDKYRKNILAKPKYVRKKQGTGNVSQRRKTLSETVDLRRVCSSPRVVVEINKLPLRSKSALEQIPKLLVGTPRMFRQTNSIKSFIVRRALDSEHEFTCQRLSSNQRDSRFKQGHDLTRKLRESSVSRPKSAPDLVRTPLCTTRKTPREKLRCKNSGSGGSVPGSARNKSHKSMSDEIAPWEQLGSPEEDVNTANARQHPRSSSPSSIKTESERKCETQGEQSSRKPGRKLKKREKRNHTVQFPSFGKARYRTVTSLVPLLGPQNMQTCPEKQKRKPKIKPNVVKRRELLFQTGIEATTAEAHKKSLTGEAVKEPTTPLGSNEQKDPLPAQVAVEEDSQWNSFMSEMTKALLNLNARPPNLPEVVETEV